VNPPTVAIIDYGIGNLGSATKALRRAGADARLTSDPEVIDCADAVVLPGVGAFGACLAALRAAQLEAAALRAVASGRPFLGICVGMQMLFDGSDEDPTTAGLGVIPGMVRWLPTGLPRPQMQWNRVSVVPGHADDPMLRGLPTWWAYFVHSLHGVPTNREHVVATCDYGITVNAVFRNGNVFATQFHPEKSGRDGLRLLANFVAVAVAGAAGDRTEGRH
jgi:imidazole glycerol-phosphate synthase subunit HisH